MKNCLRLFLCLSVVMLLPVVVFAQNMVEASRLFQQGATYFTQNRNDDAIKALKASIGICQKLGNKPCIAMNATYLGGAYDRAGDYITSHRYHLTALHTYQELNSTEDIANCMNNVGIAHQKLKNYSLSIRYHDSAVDLWKQLKAPANIAITLSSNGYNYEKLGDLEKALSCHKEALEYVKRSNVREYLAPAFYHVGTTCEKLKRYKEAEKYLTEARAIATTSGQTNWLALVSFELASLMFETWRYDEALAMYEESLRNWRKMGVKEWEASTLVQIGQVKQKSGDYFEAFMKYRDSVEIYKNMSDELGISRGLNMLAGALTYLGQYDEALHSYEVALKLSRKQGENELIASILNNIGVVYNELGDREKAINYYLMSVNTQKTVSFSKEINGNEFEKVSAAALKSLIDVKDETFSDPIYFNLACSYQELGESKKAMTYFHKALAASEKREDYYSQASILQRIGEFYLDAEDFTNAESYFKKVLKAKEKAGLPWISGGLAEVYINTGRASDALDMLKNARDDFMQPLPSRASLMAKRAKAFLKLRRYREASEDYLKAVLMYEDMREGTSDRLRFLSGSRIEAYRGLVASLCERHLASEPADVEFREYGRTLAEAAFYFSELLKARTFLESMAGQARNISRSSIPEDIRKREQELLARIASTDRRSLDAFMKGGKEFLSLARSRKKSEDELKAFIRELHDRYPFYAAVHYPRPVRAENVKLGDDQEILSYVLADSPYLISVGPHGKTSVRRLDIDTNNLEKLVVGFLKPAVDGSFHDFDSRLAHELYQYLIPPGCGNAANLIIIPDGYLGRLPFEILVTQAGPDITKNAYLGDTTGIVYEQSFAILNLINGNTNQRYRKPLFAVGNPIFSVEDIRYKNKKYGGSLKGVQIRNAAFRGMRYGPLMDSKEEIIFLPLPETEDEVKSIAALYNVRLKPLDVLLDAAATEANVRKNSLRGYRYLHFATHAGLSGTLRNVREPFLLLNQVGNTLPDDGFLTLTEVSNMQLDAEMVVLSACATGRGEFIEGEGVSSFSRAFLLAGAKSVVVSLWEAPSRETVTFMKELYSKLKSGATRTEAMRAARRLVRAQNPSPFYWGVFVMHGMM